MPRRVSLNRRRFLRASAGIAGLSALPCPAIAQSGRPSFTHGVQVGDVTARNAVLWGRADRAARMIVNWSTDESFDRLSVWQSTPPATAETDFTTKALLRDLPPDQRIFYRASFDGLDMERSSGVVSGSFISAPADKRDVTFLWSGDTAGQGWGINEDWGGMRIYETMRQIQPDFFVHCGDTIYADNPLQPTVTLPDGSLWKNLVTPEKAKVAETLDEFRGNFRYNLLDRNVLAFNAEVPIVAQWSDHEVVDNWYPAERLSDPRYGITSAMLLALRAKRAFFEYLPIRPHNDQQIYRQIAYGPNLDLFVVDTRSYRADNGDNLQAAEGDDTDFFGWSQFRWLLDGVKASRATWKVIAADEPIGLLVGGDKDRDNVANGDGPPRGREFQMAKLLQAIRDAGVKNVVWITADVHYTAAHYYDPDKAQFQDFAPFWEFVSGPLNAGTFGPGTLDDTFGPQVMFQKAPPAGQFNLPPSAGLQFFGQVEIEGATGLMTVTLKDLSGAALWSTELTPV
jgi:alkaline phosphatase D